MHRTLVIGAGKIGSLIAFLLAHSNDYQVYLGDINTENNLLKKIASSNLKIISLDAQDEMAVIDFIKQNAIQTIISSLPYYCNITIATIAKKCNVNYFDLTEDTKTTSAIAELAQKGTRAFVPQCGLAPGFISILTNDLAGHFSSLDTIKMRVGALPINIDNALQYALTWSTDGLINEYGNLCYAIENNKKIELMPLEDREEIKIDGLTYEAFNTSGGIGSLADTYFGKAKYLNYKTVRYPGHCEKIHFLMNDLKLNEDRATLKQILEKVLPKTFQDVVLIYVSVSGTQDNQFIEENYVKKFYAEKINNITWSAIQLTTAHAICAVVDIVKNHPEHYQGFIKQEQISLALFRANQFGQYYA